jgi:hypothetical protein
MGLLLIHVFLSTDRVLLEVMDHAVFLEPQESKETKEQLVLGVFPVR